MMSNETIIEEKQPKGCHTHWLRLGVFFSSIAMAIFISALGYGYFKLTQANRLLSQMVVDSQAKLSGFQESLSRVQQAVEKVQTPAQQEKKATDLYARLTVIDNQVEQLPLLLSAEAKQSIVKQEQLKPIQESASWWRKGLDRSWQALSKIILVQYIGFNATPLTTPDQKLFLYQNLHAQIESAMWGVLHQNDTVYQASLTRAVALLQRYFVQDAPETKKLLSDLQDMQKISLTTAAQTGG